MTIRAEYTLDLRCDYPGCGVRGLYGRSTYTSAAKAAARDGWSIKLLGAGRYINRFGTCRCPLHKGKRSNVGGR